MSKIKIAIFDDMPYVREYFFSLISKQNDMEVVGMADNSISAAEIAETTKPDIILMDIQMENEYSGIAATKKIIDRHPDIKIIIITIHAEDEYIIEAYAAGSVDYIIKDTEKEEICNSIRRVYNGQEFIRPFVARKLMTEFSKIHRERKSLMYMVNVMAALTKTEIDILKLIYLGNKQKEISGLLFIELRTVKFHVGNILRKMNYKNMKDVINDLKLLQIFENFYKD